MKLKKFLVFAFLCSSIALTACNVESGNPVDSSSSVEESSGSLDSNSLRVTFETFGGTKYDSVVLKKGESLQSVGTPTKDHFTFEGWYLDSKFETPYNSSMTFNESTTLYAKYSNSTSYLINYEVNGGTQKEPTYGEKDTTINFGENPVKEGYTFAGWYKDEALSQKFTDTKYSSDLTLYAKWDLLSEYAEVLFVGSFAETLVVKKGEKLETPTLEGATIDFYTTADYKTKFSFANAINQTTTVYTSVMSDGMVVSGNSVVSYDGTCETVYVPTAYNGTKVTNIGNAAFEDNQNVKSVVLPDTVNAVSEYAFYNCSYLDNINLNKNITTVGEYAFYGCSRLKSAGDLSSVTVINEGAFDGCAWLVDLTLGDNVTSVGAYAFAKCSKLASIKLTDKITAVGEYAFLDCAALEKLYVGNGLTSLGTGALKGVNVSALEFGKTNAKYEVKDDCLLTDSGKTLVLYLGGASLNAKEEFSVPQTVTTVCSYAFYNNKTLTTIKYTNNATKVEFAAYEGMTNLTTLDVPSLADGAFISSYFGAKTPEANGKIGIYTPNLKTVNILNKPATLSYGAFYGVSKLDTITGIDNIVEISEYAFAYTSVKEYKLSASATKLALNAFEGCADFAAYEVDANNAVYSVYDGVLYSKDFKTLLSCPIAKTTIDFNSNVTTIKANAFTYSNIVTLQIPNSVTELEQGALANMSKITELSVPFIGGNSENKYMLYVFGGEITTDAETGRITVTSVGNYPTSLKTIEVRETLTQIPASAFTYCVQLENVVFTSQVKSIGNYAFIFTSLNEAYLPESVEEVGVQAFASIDTIKKVVIPANVKTLGAFAFGYNKNLATVEFAESTNAMVIPTGCFYPSYSSSSSGTKYYSELESVKLSSNVTEIQDYAFWYAGSSYNSTKSSYDTTNITIEFAENSKLTTIGENAFTASGFKHLHIPASVESVGTQSFAGLSYLETISFGSLTEESKLTTIGEFAFALATECSEFVLYKHATEAARVPTLAMRTSNGTEIDPFYNNSKMTIKVYADSLETFKANWKCVADKLATID